MKNRTEIAKAYHKFLMNIDWNNNFYLHGILDSRKHFITGAVIGARDKKMCFLGKDFKLSVANRKYFCGDYYSQLAVQELQQSLEEKRRPKDLVFEHMVPKKRYIQEPCEELAEKEKDDLKLKDIEDRLKKYWSIAIITKQEDKGLLKNSMPEGWDGIDIHARYTAADITLIPAAEIHSAI